MESVPKSSPVPSEDQPLPVEVVRSGEAALVTPPPEVKNASSRVTIAFPFSQIKTQEPSAELAELAGLLVDVVAALREACPDAPLAERAEALRARTA
jgi:hypothetical protein